MVYAHVTNGTIDAVGTPPLVMEYNGRWYDLRDRDAATLAQVGWYNVAPVVKPADTATTTWDSTFVFNNNAVTQVWVQRNKTAAELAVDTATTNRATIVTQAEQALATNRTFLAIASPTNAQISAHVKALSRQNNGIIRLILDKLDGTD